MVFGTFSWERATNHFINRSVQSSRKHGHFERFNICTPVNAIILVDKAHEIWQNSIFHDVTMF